MSYDIDERAYYKFATACRSRIKTSDTSLAIAAYGALALRGSVDRKLAGERVEDALWGALPGWPDEADWLRDVDLTDDDLRAIVLNPPDSINWGRTNGLTETPDGLSAIVIRLLHLKEGERVVHLCSGAGAFAMSANERSEVEVRGVERYFVGLALSKMRASVLGLDPEMFQAGDPLEWDGTADAVYCFPPMALSPSSREREGGDVWSALVPSGCKLRSCEWLYALSAVRGLSEGGRAVLTFAGGPLFNTGDSSIRNYLVERGMVESVIALPERILNYTSLAPYLVVLSRGNEAPRFVDASDLGERGRRMTVLNDSDADEIERRLVEDGERSATADVQVLRGSGYVLEPRRHISRPTVKGGVKLRSLLTKVTRGAHLAARELEARATNEVTPYRYLMIKDVEGGEVRGDLSYLSGISANEGRYCAGDGDIVLGKMAPFKSAMMHLGEGEKVLATGNLYVLGVDEERVNPTYLLLFLQSRLCVSQLASLSVGTTIKSVPTTAFDEVLVPLPSREEQDRICERYEALRQEVRVCELKIERARGEMEKLVSGGEGLA